MNTHIYTSFLSISIQITIKGHIKEINPERKKNRGGVVSSKYWKMDC